MKSLYVPALLVIAILSLGVAHAQSVDAPSDPKEYVFRLTEDEIRKACLTDDHFILSEDGQAALACGTPANWFLLKKGKTAEDGALYWDPFIPMTEFEAVRDKPQP